MQIWPQMRGKSDMTCVRYLGYSCCGTARHIQDKGILCQQADYQWNPFSSLSYLSCRAFGSKVLCFAVRSPDITIVL